MTRRGTAVLAALVLLSGSRAVATTMSADAAYASLTSLLQKYVTPRGVRYTAWRSNGDDLKAGSAVVAALRGTEAKTLSPDELKALWINLYNVKVLELVLVGNPKTSIRDLSKGVSGGEIFDRKTILASEKGVSLNDLEKLIRNRFKDPRIQFALYRAARGSPSLRAEAYVPATLEAQLDDATRTFLARPDAVSVKSIAGRPTITVSKIFERYAEDFKAGGGPLAFLAKYGPEEAAAAAASGKAKLEFAAFDWGLNAAP